MLAGAGYATWAWAAAEGHNSAWASQLDDIGEASTESANVTVTPDKTAVTFTSTVSPTCSDTEAEAYYQDAVQAAADALGHAPSDTLLLLNGITQAWAATQCDELQKTKFSKGVSDAQVALVVFLKAIGSSDSVMTTTDGLRSYDGTQSQSFYTPMVGQVTMQARYDSTNGLNITLTREHEAFDWGAPFGR